MRNVTALQDSELWEIRRNVLDRLMRSPAQHDKFDKIYRDRSLDTVMRDSRLFQDLPADNSKNVPSFCDPIDPMPGAPRIRAGPAGQPDLRTGRFAEDFYFVRLGTLRAR